MPRQGEARAARRRCGVPRARGRPTRDPLRARADRRRGGGARHAPVAALVPRRVRQAAPARRVAAGRGARGRRGSAARGDGVRRGGRAARRRQGGGVRRAGGAVPRRGAARAAPEGDVAELADAGVRRARRVGAAEEERAPRHLPAADAAPHLARRAGGGAPRPARRHGRAGPPIPGDPDGRPDRRRLRPLPLRHRRRGDLVVPILDAPDPFQQTCKFAAAAAGEDMARGARHVHRPSQEPGRRRAARRPRRQGRRDEGGALPDTQRLRREGHRLQGGSPARLPGAEEALQEPRPFVQMPLHLAPLLPLRQCPGRRGARRQAPLWQGGEEGHRPRCQVPDRRR